MPCHVFQLLLLPLRDHKLLNMALKSCLSTSCQASYLAWAIWVTTWKCDTKAFKPRKASPHRSGLPPAGGIQAEFIFESFFLGLASALASGFLSSPFGGSASCQAPEPRHKDTQ